MAMVQRRNNKNIHQTIAKYIEKKNPFCNSSLHVWMYDMKEKQKIKERA